MKSKLITLMSVAIVWCSHPLHVLADFTANIDIDPMHIVDPSIPVIAGPTDFSAVLIDESTVELSWNPNLIDGSEVGFFKVWDRHGLLTTTKESSWQVGGIDRNFHHDFAVSAVTLSGVETRRSARIYFDLPQLDADKPDGYNRYLPPLENLRARVINADSVELTWDIPPTHWSWVEPQDYSYAIIANNTYVEVVDEPRYIYTGLADQGQVWIGVSVIYRNTSSVPYREELSSRQPHRVLVDSSNPVGTVTKGVTGFSSVAGLRAEVYSSTAAELFWSVAHNDASHVYINGVMVARIKEGRSLFIENLPPGERLLVSVGGGWPYDENAEYAFLLSYDSPLMHTYIDMPDGAVPNAGEPTPPVTGLYSDVYSSTAAEVFWNRSGDVNTRYRVYLNDDFVTDTDAISWFFSGLSSDTEHTVGVVAYEPATFDGSPSGVLVETSFTTLSEYGEAMVSCEVTGLYSSVYSSTAAEVFWDRDAAGLSYDIYLNDEFLITTDAVSWFVNELEPGSEQELKIRVSDNMCDPEVFSVHFSMPISADAAPENNAIITRDNYIELLEEVFLVYVGEYYTTPLVDVTDFSITGRDPDFSFTDVFDCISGNYQQELDPTSTNAGVFFTFTFDQCELDGENRNGYISGQEGARGLNFDTDQYSVNYSNGDHYQYTGLAQIWRSQTAFFDRIHSFDTTDFSVTASISGAELMLDQMTTSFAYGNHINGLDRAWLRGGFSNNFDTIDGASVTVSTPVDFDYALNTRTDGQAVDGIEPTPTPASSEQRNSWTFTSGQLDIVAQDGSSLLLDANTGDASTVRITLASDNSVEVFTQAWSLWSGILRFEDYQDLTR